MKQRIKGSQRSNRLQYKTHKRNARIKNIMKAVASTATRTASVLGNWVFSAEKYLKIRKEAST